MADKPIGRKAYGSIGHLLGSRLGPGDRTVHAGQARIVTERARDRHDVVLVQEKLDGSCCAVARVGASILALGRRGYLAQSSVFEQHQLFAAWVREHEGIFAAFLGDGERVVGEWLAQAHGTRYDAADPAFAPFVVFDLMTADIRTPWNVLLERVGGRLVSAAVIANDPTPIEDALRAVASSMHGAIDPVEGVVYRCERHGRVDFLAKYVRHDKVDGCYLPEISGGSAIWNWRPR